MPAKKCAKNTKKWCTAKSKKKSFRLDKCARTCMKYCDAAKDKAYKKKCCDAAPGPSEPDTGTGTEGTGTEGTEGTGTEGTGTSSESEPECVDTVPTKKCAENPNTKKWCTAKSKKKSFRLDKCARTCMKYCDAAKDKAYKKKCCK